MAIDEAKLQAFMGKMLGDMGAAMGAALVLVGDKLGLYRAMAGAGPISSADLAQRTATDERYVREWLAAQAAAGYLDYAGTWMIVEPYAGDRVEDNLNPIGRTFYAASTTICHDLHSCLTRAGSRTRAGRAGRRAAHSRGGDGGRLHAFSARDRDAV
jgi:hypothetical protein